MSRSAEIKVNEVYLPAFSFNERYLILYGGSGSGKSVFASQKIITRTVGESKHRFLVIRKVANTLRSSVYQLLLDQLSEYGLRHEFEINKTEMRFTHLPTGNEILLCGLDDVERLKSITGITGIWIEEATDLTEDDFDQVDLRLRGETINYKQIILTFNPIDESHWLKKRFFDTKIDNSFVTKTTFKDNHFIDDEYRKVLENKASVSPNLYRIYYLGEWGREDVKRPYCYNFNRDKHVSSEAIYNPQRQIIFSLDFNVEPFVCVCSQQWRDSAGEHKHFFKELVIETNGDVHEMCDLIERTFGRSAIANALFTGDAMQRKREITQRDNVDAWRIIDSRFHLGKRLKVPRANPSVKENRFLVNTLLAFHPDFKFHPDMKLTIYQMQFTEVDEEGSLIKKDRNDEKQRADALDAVRYDCNVFLHDYLDRYRLK